MLDLSQPEEYSDEPWGQDAAKASVGLLRQSHAQDALEMDCSLLLPMAGGPGRLRSIRWAILLKLLAIVLLLGLGASFLYLNNQATPAGQAAPTSSWRIDSPWVLAAGICVVLAVFLLSLLTRLTHALAWLMLRPHLAHWRAVLPEAPHVMVYLENAGSYHKLKIAPEDVAMAYFDTPGQRLILQGLRYRYILLAEDVIHAGLRPSPGGGLAVTLQWRIARQTELAMVLVRQGLAEELKRQIPTRGFPGVARQLETTLGIHITPR